jgi:hypothetical protein
LPQAVRIANARIGTDSGRILRIIVYLGLN